MANHTVSVIGRSNMNATIISPTSLTVAQGDSITFVCASNSSASATVSGFNSTYFTSTSNLTLAPGASGTRYIKTNAPLGTLTNQYKPALYAGYGTTQLLSITINSSTDTTPDQFNIGPNISGVPLNTWVFAGSFKLTGINTGVTMSSSNGQIRRNGGSWATSFTAYNNDNIDVQVLSNNAYSSSKTCTVSCGGVSDSVVVTTMANPGSGELIPLGITSGTIALSDIIDHFGGDEVYVSVPQNLGAYYRGGPLVPPLSQNSSISTNGSSLRISQFYGAYHSLFYSKPPSPQTYSISTVGSSRTGMLSWAFNRGQSQDPILGYGNIAFTAMQYKYVLYQDPANAGNNIYTGVSMSNTNNTWVTNSGVTLSVTCPSNSERTYKGYVRIYARSTLNTAYQVIADAHYAFRFFGP